MNAWWIVLAAAGVNTVAGILLKQSRVEASGGPLWELIYSPWFLAAGACYATNVFLFAKALDHMPLSLVYPAFAGLGFALIAVAGNLLFDERLGPGQWLGVVLIFAGIVAAARSA
jgi:multidrug transporter EmrE-like cation transporter